MWLAIRALASNSRLSDRSSKAFYLWHLEWDLNIVHILGELFQNQNPLHLLLYHKSHILLF